MPLFRIKGRGVSRVLPQEHRVKEEVIHRLIEDNLTDFFGDLQIVARKPRIGGKEFDTLALNKATNAPVIIEYKREKNRSVIEQVDLYYVKLKHNKPDVMILLQQQDAIDDLGQVDFENPEIIVVAKEFTPEQREILTMKSGYLRLFRYLLYEGKLLSLEEVEPLGLPDNLKAKSRVGDGGVDQPYGLEHFGMRSEIAKLYEKLDKGIRSLDSRIKPGKINKYFVGYGATGAYFCNVSPHVKSLRVAVKCVRRPLKPRGLKIQKLPDYRSMTHVFNVASSPQLKPAIRVIKAALEDSL
jgi:predicted transport protein